jgi:hypothetical protein
MAETVAPPARATSAAVRRRTLVTNGSGAMPSFGGQRAPEPLRQVVEYTHSL